MKCEVSQTNDVKNHSAYSSAWTGFLMVFNYYSWHCVNANQLPTPTQFYMPECQNSQIQSSTSRVFVSIPIPWIYSSLLWTTKTVQHTSAQSISTFSALILAGERPGISTARLFLQHDYLSGQLCMGLSSSNAHLIRWGASSSLFTFLCTFIFGAGIQL